MLYAPILGATMTGNRASLRAESPSQNEGRWMSQGDRNERDRRGSTDQNRDRANDDRQPASSSSRRTPPPADDEFNIPPWSGSLPRNQGSRRDGNRTGSNPTRSEQESAPPPSSGGRRDPLPQLGDAFKRRRLSDDEFDDR